MALRAGKTAPIATCRRCLCALLALFFAFGLCGVAQAAPTAGVTLKGTATDGTDVAVPVEIVSARLETTSPPGTQVAPVAGDDFLWVSFQSPQQIGNTPSFDGIENITATDVHVNGTIPPASAPQMGSVLDGTWSFAVAPTTREVAITIAPVVLDAAEYPTQAGTDGKLTEITVQAVTFTVAVTAMAGTGTQGSVPTTTAGRQKAASTSGHGKAAGSSAAVAKTAAAGGGGVVLLLVVVPIFLRRRREKVAQTIVIVTGTPAAPGSPARSTSRDGSGVGPSEDATENLAVEVRVLGPVDVEGLRAPITRGPVTELLCFLALHPGRSFGSAELRAAIWAPPREEIAAKTLRDYLVHLRRALPEGALVTEGREWSLTGAVATDWQRFCEALGGDGDRTQQLRRALTYVRGAPLAYEWASSEGLRYEMEAKIDAAAQELCGLGLAAGDTELATFAVDRGLAACPRSLALCEDRLRIAANHRSRSALARALEEACGVLPEDADALRAFAERLAGERTGGDPGGSGGGRA